MFSFMPDSQYCTVDTICCRQHLDRFDDTEIRLFPPYIAIVGMGVAISPGKIQVHVRELPRELFCMNTKNAYPLAEDKIPIVGWKSYVADYERLYQTGTPSFVDFIPPYPLSGLNSFTMAFLDY